MSLTWTTYATQFTHHFRASIAGMWSEREAAERLREVGSVCTGRNPISEPRSVGDSIC